ncbi:hypothetical protein [Kitasatospora sp. NPDC057015]|uniref:hypothetical protein n=1 Tax=Kitasatospora sp. NPDC057015 TaxID=3346001 RepID=UPI00363913A4
MSAQEELLAAVHRLTWPGKGGLDCDEAGHPSGHVCLEPTDENDLSALREALCARYGRPRNLAMGGYVDPTVTARTGLPLLTPFGERVVEMGAWAYGGRWIGCGTVRFGDAVRTVALVAEREVPAADPSANPAANPAEVTSWVDDIVAVTGWDTTRARTVDWAAAEARIGTALPGDYKQLAEVFGYGAFDGYLQLHLPGAGSTSGDIVLYAEWLGEWAGAHAGDLWKPYGVYPVPGGLLQWAASETADRFYWLTEGPDPDRWPVLASDETHDSWERFDGTTAEFVHRMLTDRQHPFSTAQYFDTHWFESYEGEEG